MAALKTLHRGFVSLDKERSMSQSVTTTGIAAHIAVIDGQPTTTTQDIADVYGKRHDDVLRIIRQRMAECPEEWCLRNFAETETERPSPLNGAPIKSPVIRMTKKGFHFVVGKFTGIKAVQHQIAFADEFERMEQTLSASDRITPAQCQHLKELAQLVVESGKQGHAETWSRFCRKFKINKYELLPPKQFDAACKYLQGKMDGESIAALVKKHYPAAVAALPAPEASIDVKALLLGGQNSPIPFYLLKLSPI
jgi:Rha family phage regulatory protein